MTDLFWGVSHTRHKGKKEKRNVQMTDEKKWMTIGEVVKVYGRNPSSWRKLAREGKVMHKGTRKFLLQVASVEAYLGGGTGTEADNSPDEKAELEKEIDLYDKRQEAESRRLGYPDFAKFKEERDSLAARIADLEQGKEQVRQAEEAIKQREDRIDRKAARVSAAHVSLREQRELLLGDYEDMEKIYKDAKPIAQKYGLPMPQQAYKAFYEGEGGFTAGDINDYIGDDIDTMLEELGEEEGEE